MRVVDRGRSTCCTEKHASASVMPRCRLQFATMDSARSATSPPQRNLCTYVASRSTCATLSETCPRATRRAAIEMLLGRMQPPTISVASSRASLRGFPTSEMRCKTTQAASATSKSCEASSTCSNTAARRCGHSSLAARTYVLRVHIQCRFSDVYILLSIRSVKACAKI